MRRILVSGIVAAALAAGPALLGISPAGAATLGGEQLALPGVQVSAGAGATPLPTIKARTWILADATTGEVLAAKRAHKPRPPASTLKTLTSLALLPRLALNGTVTATAKAANIYGAKAGLAAGQQYTIEQLFYGMMLPSGNDAAIALAQAAGGVKATVAAMNAVAQQLQAADTRALTPNGLDAPGQTSSAYDLALIARAALARSDFTQIVSTKKYLFPSKGGGQHPIYNLNQMLTSGYRGAIGVKTGFTTNAGRTFIGAATRKGRTLIFVGMGIRESSKVAAEDAITWGFANRTNLTPIGTLVEPLSPLPTVGQQLPAAAASSDQSLAAVPVAAATAPAAPTLDPVALKAIDQAALKVPAEQAQAPSFWLGVIALAVIGLLLLAFNASRNRRRRFR
ncbi:MAG: serine hydrolase [Candidatus Nanopelagicales bacterium]|nr:serine hydrolase [Candidatus Nanopelagicales bacterium]